MTARTKSFLLLLAIPVMIVQLHGQQSISARALVDIYKNVSFHANWGNARIISPTGSVQSIAMDTTIEHNCMDLCILKTAPFRVAALDAHASLDYSLSLRSTLTHEQLEKIKYPFPLPQAREHGGNSAVTFCFMRLELVDAKTGATVGERQSFTVRIQTDQEGAYDTTSAGSADFTIPQEAQGRMLQIKATVLAHPISLSAKGERVQWLHNRASSKSVEFFSGEVKVDPDSKVVGEGSKKARIE